MCVQHNPSCALKLCTENENLPHILYELKLHSQAPITVYFCLTDVSRSFRFDLFSIPADVCVGACDGLGQAGPLINSPVRCLQHFPKNR